MPLRQWDHPIQTLPPNRADHPFANGICFRSRYWGTQHSEPQCLDGGVQLLREDAVSIVDQAFVSILVDRFSQLLQRPIGSWRRSRIHVHQSPASMLDDHEHIESPERHGYRNEEVARNDRLGVI